MLKHKTKIGLVSFACAALAYGASAQAQEEEDVTAKPGGPWLTENQNVSLEAYHTNEELTKDLQKIAKRSKGLVEVESAGTTGDGRPIWLAKIGDPSKTPVLIMTQQHGDEPHGTETALDIIQNLGTGSAKANRILDELYVLIIVRVNPDGAAIPTRGNANFSAPPRIGCACPAAGGVNPICTGVFTTFLDGLWSYDINRYHWGDWEDSWQFQCNLDQNGDPIFPTNPVPEAVAALETYAEYQPIWVIDVHNQGFNVIDPEECLEGDPCRPDRRVTGSIFWPINPGVDQEAVDLSKQMALVIKKRSLELGNMELTRFGGGTFAGIARNAYGLLGTERINNGEPGPIGGSILVEIQGQIEGDGEINIGQKSIGMLKKNVREILTSVLLATADGSVLDEDPDQAEILILNNDMDLDNPRLAEE